MVRVDRVTGETMCDPAAAGARRAGAALALGHAARACRRTIRRSSTRRPTRCSDRRIAGLSWVADQRRPDDQPDRDDIVTMGVKGSDIQHLAQRRHRGVADDRRRFAESPKRAGRALRRHRRRQPAGVARRGQDVDADRRRRCRACRRALRVRSRAVAVRRGHGLRDVRRSPAERLRDLHLREQRLRPDVAVDRRRTSRARSCETLTEDLKNPDVLYLGTETGLFVSHRSRQELGAPEGQPADRAHRRDHAAPARQRDDPRDARPRDLDPRSPRADPGVRGGADGDRRREAVHAAADADVPAAGARSQLRVLGRPDVLRREPAAGGGHLLVQEEAGRRA